MSAGKGDRPRWVNRKTYEANFDQIDWRQHCKSCGGKGMTLQTPMYGNSSPDEADWDDCADCEGTGKKQSVKQDDFF